MFHTDAVVPSSDHCCTETVAPSCDHCFNERVAPSSDNYCIDIVVSSSDHLYTQSLRQYRHLVIITALIKKIN